MRGLCRLNHGGASSPGDQGSALRKGRQPEGGARRYVQLLPVGRADAARGVARRTKLPAYEALAGYVFFTATGDQFDPRKVDRTTGFISRSRGTDVYVIYEPDRERIKDLALTLEFARSLPKPKRADRLVCTHQAPRSGVPGGVPHHLLPVAVSDLPGDGGLGGRRRAERDMILKEFQQQALAAVPCRSEARTPMSSSSTGRSDLRGCCREHGQAPGGRLSPTTPRAVRSETATHDNASDLRKEDG